MTFFELDDFIADKYNTKYIKGETDPENFDLILGNKRSQPGNSKDRYYVHQIMSATRNHGGGRSSSRNTNYFTHALSIMHQTFNVLVQCNLNSKTYYQTDNKIPKGRKLALSKAPARNQCEYRKINTEQYYACERSVQN